MVNYKASLDSTFAALSDPTRRAILTRLRKGSASVMELAEPFQFSLPAISKHLRVLERAGFIFRTKQGRVHRLKLVAQPMKDAAEWIESYRAFWEGQLDSLADYLGSLKKKEKRK
jgi:DNA-binding transcriptional ArsR family regulator